MRALWPTAITLSGEGMVSHFNRGGQLIAVSDVGGHVLTLGYDRNRLVSIGDAADRYDYDEHGLLSTVTDREGHQTRYGYVPLSFGRLDSIEDAIGHVAIKLDYDGQQRVTTEHFAFGRSSQCHTSPTLPNNCLAATCATSCAST